MLLRFSSTPEQARKERFGSSELNVCPPNPANQNGRFGPLDADFAAAMNADWSIKCTFATRHPLARMYEMSLRYASMIIVNAVGSTRHADDARGHQRALYRVHSQMDARRPTLTGAAGQLHIGLFR